MTRCMILLSINLMVDSGSVPGINRAVCVIPYAIQVAGYGRSDKC